MRAGRGIVAPRLRARRACAGLAFSLAALTASAGSGAPPAQGGRGILDALERAPATVVGVVRAPHALDRHAFAATLQVETVLVGEASAGDSLRFAWEELARARAVRFREGERVLASLTERPTSSLWKERLQDEPTARVLYGDGRAFLREPTRPIVAALSLLAATAPAARRGEAAIEPLSRLVLHGPPSLGMEAMTWLVGIPELDGGLSAAARRDLVAALARDDVDVVFERQALDLLGRRRLVSLVPLLERRLASDPETPAVLVEALAVLGVPISAERAAALLQDPRPAHRAAAVRQATRPDADALLPPMIRTDPSAAVRIAALERWAELHGASAREPLVEGLYDEDPRVASRAAALLAASGPGAVPRLRDVAFSGDGRSAQFAVAALRDSGPDGAAVLVELASEHDSRAIRTLAGIAIGRPLQDD